MEKFIKKDKVGRLHFFPELKAAARPRTPIANNIGVAGVCFAVEAG
jgi:hypothetical protein